MVDDGISGNTYTSGYGGRVFADGSVFSRGVVEYNDIATLRRCHPHPFIGQGVSGVVGGYLEERQCVCYGQEREGLRQAYAIAQLVDADAVAGE